MLTWTERGRGDWHRARRTTAASTVDTTDFDDIFGSPRLVRSGDGLAVANATRIDWASIVGGLFEAEYNYYPGWDTSYPTILITGDTTINNLLGMGLLIVTGNLTLTGMARWDGVVLVGGGLTADFPSGVDPRFRGVTVTGLNAQLGGMPPPANQIIGDGRPDFLYRGCEVENALNSLIGFVPIQNAWIDNWAMY